MVEVDKRAFVAALYSGEGWKRKVAAMSDAQITAIYLREHDKPPKQQKPKGDEPKNKESGGDDIPF